MRTLLRRILRQSNSTTAKHDEILTDMRQTTTLVRAFNQVIQQRSRLPQTGNRLGDSVAGREPRPTGPRGAQ